LELDPEAETEVEEFKKKIVYKEVVRVCLETSIFDDWLVRQKNYVYDTVKN